MAFGPGKYDHLATEARSKAGETASVVLIVLNGEVGSGMSVQATPDLLAVMPAILRNIADQVESDLNPATKA